MVYVCECEECGGVFFDPSLVYCPNCGGYLWQEVMDA